MSRKSRLVGLIYPGVLAIVGGTLTFQLFAFDGDLSVLTVLWWLALPMTPLLFVVTIFLAVLVSSAWGNVAVLIAIPVLSALLFFAAGYIQASALRGIMRHFRQRKSTTNDI